MKAMLGIVLSVVVSSAMAADFRDRVNYYVEADVQPSEYSIVEEGGQYRIDSWNEATIGKPQPTLAKLNEPSDEEVDSWDGSRAGQQRKFASMAAIKSASESNLVALAASVGATNTPIDWVTLQVIGDQMLQQAKAVQQTNTLAGLLLRVDALELQQKVAVLYDFYTGNGGDPRKAGKKTK